MSAIRGLAEYCKLGSVGMAVLVLLSCGGKPPQAEETVIRPVRVAEVHVTGGKRTRTFSGSARAGHESKLSFRINGTLEELPVKLGDRVTRGQVIGRLDARDYELQSQQAEAALAQARAQERNANASYERMLGLYEKNSVSINDLDSARAAMESARAQVSSLEKKLELTDSQLSYTTLISPLDGFIAALYAEVNENVRAGQSIALLNAGSRPEITFVVPEQLIRQIREGDAVTVAFDSLPGQKYGATITEVGVATGSMATTFPVTATLNNPNEEVRQGMACEVFLSFESAEGQPVIFVKPKAVAEDQDGRFAYVAVPGDGGLGKVERRNVETGILTEDGLEIRSGLEDGDLLIVAGLRFLQQGQLVRLPGAGDGQ